MLPTGLLPINAIVLSWAGVLNTRIAGGCLVWMYDRVTSELRGVCVYMCAWEGLRFGRLRRYMDRDEECWRPAIILRVQAADTYRCAGGA